MLDEPGLLEVLELPPMDRELLSEVIMAGCVKGWTGHLPARSSGGAVVSSDSSVIAFTIAGGAMPSSAYRSAGRASGPSHGSLSVMWALAAATASVSSGDLGATAAPWS
ncbi:hypothetical protein GCM10010411_77250 [Actinomadura fulvescens]|uniref:Uncharacterized protein n=1 Tax=Actinomadura fulvescens TaxID=46160 RepID=A0ABN3QKD1_9ACTN